MIVTDDLDEYVALKGLVNYCSYTYESDTCCKNCKLKELCSVAVGCSTLQKLRIEYISDSSIAPNNSLTRALEKVETLDE
jgi:hypothetical protein